MKKDLVQETLEEKIVKSILPEVKEKIIQEVDEITGNLRKNIKTVVIKDVKGKKKQITTLVHKKFDQILLLVSNKIPVMLTGGAGAGKSSTCEKVAEALGLDFYSSSAITQEYKLTGFIDANGNYQETQFYKAFKNGGLFVLDEIDASVPEALVVINTAVANGYFDFPCGKVEAHENFRLVACANTYGLGGDDVYVGRNQLDGASLDRFAVVYFDYDKVLEKNLVINTEWADFIQALRDKLKQRKIKHIVSMRATIYGDKLIEAGLDLDDIFKQVIFKNLQIDDIKSIGELSNGKENKYIEAFNEVVNK
jgi:MoxR-like ATPase